MELSRLLDLSQELLDSIVGLLDSSDVGCLRATSSSMNKRLRGHPDRSFTHKTIELRAGKLVKVARMMRRGGQSCLLQHLTVKGLVRRWSAGKQRAVGDVGRDEGGNAESCWGDVEGERAETEANMSEAEAKKAEEDAKRAEAEAEEAESEAKKAEADAEQARDKQAQRFLTQIFRNVKLYGPRKRLATLSLTVKALEDDDVGYRDVWDTALRTFTIVMGALRASGLPVAERLDIFSSLKACSLEADALLAMTQDASWAANFRWLKHLAVSLSLSPKHVLDRIPLHYSMTLEQMKDQNRRELNQRRIMVGISKKDHVLENIMHLARIMPRLQMLDLHWYNLMDASKSLVMPSTTGLRMEQSVVGLRLQQCTLRGIRVAPTVLVDFLKAAQPANLALVHTTLLEPVEPVLAFLSSRDSPVTAYRLDDVLAKYDLVHFAVRGQSKFAYLGDTLGPSVLARQGEGVHDAVAFRVTQARPLGSGAYQAWIAQREGEYGPPSRGKEGFVALNRPEPEEAEGEKEGWVHPRSWGAKASVDRVRSGVQWDE